MQRQRRRWLTWGMLLAVSATLVAGDAKFAGADPYKGAVAVRKDGSELLYLRKNEIVKNGTVVGEFDGSNVRADGTIWWEGSRWGSLKPYKATRTETMRLVVALYYFSDYFKKK